MNVIRKIMCTFAVVRQREQAVSQQFEPVRLRSACAVLAPCGGRTVAYIASEALCFFQTENFDNSHEKLEKRGRSSLGIDNSGCYPLASYKGVSCSSNLFSGSRRPSVD